MIQRSFLLISMFLVLLMSGCKKESYDMDLLSEKIHFSPTLAISAVKGDVSFSDMVKVSENVIFDQDNLLKIVFKKDSIIDLELADFLSVKKGFELGDKDFGKGALVQKVAPLDPFTMKLEIGEILNHISGDFSFSNPIVKIYYSNSFPMPVEIDLNAAGIRDASTVDLNLSPFTVGITNTPDEQDVYSLFTIDKTNSSLPAILSMPPTELKFSGTAMINATVKNSEMNNILSTGHLIGRLEIEVPMELSINNLQFADTVDNFLKDDGGSSDNPVKPEDFELLSVVLAAKNGFPLGVSIEMSLYDSLTQSIESTITANEILDPAPVDSDGKVTGVTETSTPITFTKEFFSSVNKADKIIFKFKLKTTDNGIVKIYSDYRIDFNAALSIKPVINFK